MSEPVLVIHGVANRDADAFDATVRSLQQRVGADFNLIPVFWGDLGGVVGTGLRDVLPRIFPDSEHTRADTDFDVFFAAMWAERQRLLEAEDVRSRPEDETANILHQATLDALGIAADADGVRADDALSRALSEEIPATTYLKDVRDAGLARAVGELLAEHLRMTGEPPGLGPAPGRYETRTWLGDRGADLKTFIAKIDQLVGKVSSNAAGVANQWLRGKTAELAALTLGDIVAYHQRRQDIHARLFEVLDRQSPGSGTAARPIYVLAHSLGGLVTLDAALGSDVLADDGLPRKLHIKNWVTFGSQPGFFHIVAPRQGIEPYVPGRPCGLPNTIGRWINLWHPMDLLAFVAAPVFRLSDGTSPEDIRVDAGGSDILQNRFWLHSVYWTSPQLAASLKAKPSRDAWR